MIGSNPSDRVNPLQLSGLRQALFVLRCFENGMNESDISALFQGDEQLVAIWQSFLIHNHWMEMPDGKWVVTGKGKEWLRKFNI